MKYIGLLAAAVFLTCTAPAQTVQVLSTGKKVSLRGLSVVNDNIVWASGSSGTVARSTDGGNSWKWTVVKGFEKTEFRDIEAFDSLTAVIMAVAEPAFILKTTDGGTSWKEVYRNDTKGMFLDAMDFWGSKAGIVIGDPINGKFFLAETSDVGDSWKEIPAEKRPAADSGEACFASSGTNIRKLNKKESVFVSGGMSAHIFLKNGKVRLPLLQGKESTGANSVAVRGKKMIMVAGGDFNLKDSSAKNCYYSTDGGTTWEASQTGPHGYRSCIEYCGKKIWIAAGLSGVDFSADNGRNFTLISKESFHVCRKAKHGNAIFFVGNNGKIGKILPETK